MLLHKIHHPDNFDFVHQVRGRGSVRRASTRRRQFEVETLDLGDGVSRFRVVGKGFPQNVSLCELNEEFSGVGSHRLQLGPRGELAFRAAKRKTPELWGLAGASFGFSGAAWMLRLEGHPEDRFFGMGEKWGPLEKSGLRSQFWTTDIWADFSLQQVENADIDCTYVSIPYVIIERQGTFFGVLLDCSYRCFMATNPVMSMMEEGPFAEGEPSPQEVKSPLGYLYFGAVGGRPSVYFLVGPTLRDLTRKFQRLVGPTPRPPLWALGHHQSRWGYGTYDDLRWLDEQFARYEIPTDGLWLDIDYMNGFRVFTTAPGAFPEKEIERDGAKSAEVGPFEFSSLAGRRRHVVPILDPGVKVEPGYRIHDEGLAGGHFCVGPTGEPYVGIVWPGRTYFPDFSQKKTRRFWASHVGDFAQRGFDGFWIDMNDPSTGPVENQSMLFRGGRIGHEAFHNEYALGMAQATRQGLEEAYPHRRPFVLSRSAFTTTGRYAAVWTGDNISSFRHLAASIPVSLNLALSGIPFNGPDVPGFGGEATKRLAVRFYQLAFLFPFLRNHSVHGSSSQEPWAFGQRTMSLLRRYIRLRYRMLPYLYQLFIRQEDDGSPILSPLFMDSASPANLERCSDEFLVGRLLCAPVVSEANRRPIELPEGRWFCLRTGRWHRGPRTFETNVSLAETPVFVRSGTALPMTPRRFLLCADGGVAPPLERLTNIELHLFLQRSESCQLVYTYDDGSTNDYRKGSQRSVHFQARRIGERVEVATKAEAEEGLPPLRCRLVIHAAKRARLFLNEKEKRLSSGQVRFCGQSLPCVFSSFQVL